MSSAEIALLPLADTLAAAGRIVAHPRRKATMAPLADIVSLAAHLQRLHEIAVLAAHLVDPAAEHPLPEDAPNHPSSLEAHLWVRLVEAGYCREPETAEEPFR